ncbi:hypothetical protein RYX36_016080, partial [Vicia faba]
INIDVVVCEDWIRRGIAEEFCRGILFRKIFEPVCPAHEMLYVAWTQGFEP